MDVDDISECHKCGAQWLGDDYVHTCRTSENKVINLTANPGDQFVADVMKVTDDAFNQGAATALRVARDGLAKAASSKFDNALTAHEIVMIMNDLIKITVKGKK